MPFSGFEFIDFSSCVSHPATYDRKPGLEFGKLIDGTGHRIFAECDDIDELTRLGYPYRNRIRRT